MLRLIIAGFIVYGIWRLYRKLRSGTLVDTRREITRLDPQRDDARLDGDESGVDVTHETIDLSGKPLKEGHRRRGLRDPRLLPKKKRTWRDPKPPKQMSHDDATRLFAGTLRTRNRTLRDLLPDEEQLARYGLPAWRNEADVAAALGIDEKTLRHFAVHRQRERVPHYVTFAIPKRSGGERLIMAPKKELKALQRKLNTLLIDKLPVSDAAHGFRAGRSIATNAAAHVARRVVVKLDIEDFFPSLHYGRVRGLFVSLGYGYPVAAGLAALVTECERQPVQTEEALYHVPVGARHTGT